MMSIDDPVALAVMEWLSPQAGGRRSGPPSWPYAATCDFLEEDMRQREPGVHHVHCAGADRARLGHCLEGQDRLPGKGARPASPVAGEIHNHPRGRPFAAVAMITDVLVEIT